jgi:hypothetical protein
MSQRETVLMTDIRAALVKDDRARVWRNNVGQTPCLCEACRFIVCSRCAAKFRNPVRYGLAVGSSDLVGIIRPTGRFIGLEVKTDKGIVSEEQEAWIQTVRRFGGVASVVRSVEDALGVLDAAK